MSEQDTHFNNVKDYLELGPDESKNLKTIVYNPNDNTFLNILDMGISNLFIANTKQPLRFEIDLKKPNYKNYDDTDSEYESEDECNDDNLIYNKKNSSNNLNEDDNENTKKLFYYLNQETYYNFVFNDKKFVVFLKESSCEPLRDHNWHYHTFKYIHIFTSTKDCTSQDVDKYLIDLSEICHKFFQEKYLNILDKKNSISVYVAENEYFRLLTKINKREFNSVYLPKKTIKSINQSLDTFLEPINKQRYRFLGIPYKLNIFFSGKPGTGKTTTIKSIASRLNRNLKIINFTPNLTDDVLISLMRNVSNKDIVVLEDIDCIFQERKSKDESKNMITFSAILNVLDGITTTDGQIIIMSSNYKKVLDKALIRPGRIDHMFEFDFMRKTEMKKMFLNFCYIDELIELQKFNKIASSDIINQETKTINQEPKTTSKEEQNTKFEEFYTQFKGLGINITACLLQGFLLKYFNDPDAAIENIDNLKEMYDEHNMKEDADLYS